MRTVLCVAAVLVLGGCAGNVKQVSCIENDWAQVGYDTAIAGKSVRTFDTYNDRCVEAPGEDAKKIYVDGFMKGIIEFCTYDNGYQWGLENKSPAGVCPLELRRPFQNGYRVGKLQYDEKMHRMNKMAEDAMEAEFKDSQKEATPSASGNPR